jgi:hypothetical protein
LLAEPKNASEERFRRVANLDVAGTRPGIGLMGVDALEGTRGGKSDSQKAETLNPQGNRP